MHWDERIGAEIYELLFRQATRHTQMLLLLANTLFLRLFLHHQISKYAPTNLIHGFNFYIFELVVKGISMLFTQIFTHCNPTLILTSFHSLQGAVL